MTVKALCINLDGTLIDTVPALYQVYLKFMNHFGIQGTKEEFQTLVGPSIDEIVVILKKKHNLQEAEQELSTYYVSLLMMQGFEGTELFPDVRETLDGLKKKGVKLALVTSGTMPLVKACLDPLKISSMFDTIITSDKSKTSDSTLSVYQNALHELSINPADAVAIEDSIEGSTAASEAGLSVLRLTKDAQPKTEKNGVAYVKNWKEISEWLQRR